QKIKTYASKTDILVISAGTSKGIKDITAKAVEDAAGKIHFHGVAIQPGKPVLFAEVGDVPVIGLPGYAAAAFIAAHLYLRPLVTHFSGVGADLPRSNFISAEELAPRPVDSFYRIQLYDVDGQVYARKIARGASSLVSLSEMDGLMHVPPNVAIKKRDAVRVDIIRDRAQNSVVATGVDDPNTHRLFDLVRECLPQHRLLFFDATSEKALQNIVERNTHLAIISTPDRGVDIFPAHTKQLQEPQHRYRLFTRTAGLIFRGAEKKYATLGEVPMGLRLMVPEKREPLWDQFRFALRLDELKFRPQFGSSDENSLTSALGSEQWDAVFADIRFMKQNQYCVASVLEHVDLVAPESFLTLEPVKKLIDLLLSDAFGKWVATQTGCDGTARGLV
ncbi:MAG TPA: molybdopterin-binding protein, partial [Acidobacteriota bacterium]